MPEGYNADETRARCQVILDSLDIPQPFELPTFVAYIASLRGRQISVRPFRAGPDGMCGAWIRARSADYIYHDDQTTALHRAHIVLHELAHMLLGHKGTGSSLLSELRHLIALGAADAMKGAEPEPGGSYTSAEEREAEMLGSMILERASRQPTRLPALGGPAGEPLAVLVIERLDQAIGRGPGAAR
jgi:hypothetical protein